MHKLLMVGAAVALISWQAQAMPWFNRSGAEKLQDSDGYNKKATDKFLRKLNDQKFDKAITYLQKGANPNIRDRNTYPAIILSARAPHLLNAIIAADGRNLELSLADGYNALFVTIGANNLLTTTSLLDAGAQVDPVWSPSN